ncbi:hypothetical protein DPMN_101158 [Dreissena polymorpha]|uniref:Uncharacterized protein n=1 Tax=Dreissena polymorpha TaxID=45954 RepID=A0A9D4LH06_DREPO|nr:hypothetical protein DPMN_101158 [Dreissena polymorpha]
MTSEHPGSIVFQQTRTIFINIQDIIKTNILTKTNAPPPGNHFHEDQTVNVASRVKNAPPLGGHVCQANLIIFKLIQDIIETNLLTKFHEDWTINVASRVLKRQMLTTHDERQTKGDHKSSP